MALAKLEFVSQTLGRAVEANVILPQGLPRLPENVGQPPFPVLYLLHGLEENHNSWLRNCPLQRYAEERNLCIVMPDGQRGFYCDTAYGTRYFSFVSQELPRVMAAYFPISQKREDTWLCGLSMGGYGALKLALSLPERYGFAAALSPPPLGRLMWEEWRKARGESHPLSVELKHIFGESIASENDLFALSAACAQKSCKPSLMLCCGGQDELYPLNLALKSKLEQDGHSLIWEADAQAAHNWEYWSRQIQTVLNTICHL